MQASGGATYNHTRFAHGPQCVARGIMLMFHHRHRILHAAEGRWQDGFLLDNGLLHPYDVGEQDPLFFHHVSRQFLGQALKAGADLLQFGMVLPVDGANLIEKRAETRHFFARVLMVCVLDVGDQVGEGLCLPVAVFLGGMRRLLGHLQRIHHLIDREIGRAASFFQRFVAAAAIVDT